MRCNLLEVQQTHTALPIVCSKACFQELWDSLYPIFLPFNTIFLYVCHPTVYSNWLSTKSFFVYSLEFVKLIINNFHQAIFHQESLSHRKQKSSCNPILDSQLILNASFSMIDSHRNQELSQESSLTIGCLFTFEQCCSTWRLDMSPSYREFTKKQVRQQAKNTKAQHRNNEFQSTEINSEHKLTLWEWQPQGATSSTRWHQIWGAVSDIGTFGRLQNTWSHWQVVRAT